RNVVDMEVITSVLAGPQGNHLLSQQRHDDCGNQSPRVFAGTVLKEESRPSEGNVVLARPARSDKIECGFAGCVQTSRTQRYIFVKAASRSVVLQASYGCNDPRTTPQPCALEQPER